MSLEDELSSLAESGADRLDPAGFRYVEALARRARTRSGAAREQLEALAREALEEFRNRLDDARIPAGEPTAPEPGILSELNALLNRAAETDDSASIDKELQRQEAEIIASLDPQAATRTQGSANAPVEMRSARLVKSSLSKLGTDQLLNRALADKPEDSGPLNPQMLSIRSLETMRELSPAYLERFTHQIDTLFRLEQASWEPQ